MRMFLILASITIATSQVIVPLGSYMMPSIGVAGAPGNGLYFISSGTNPVGAVCFVDQISGPQVAGCMDDEGTRIGATGAIRFTSGAIQGNFTFNNGGITTTNTHDGTLSACNGSCADNDHNGSWVMTNMTAYGNVRNVPSTFAALPACTSAREGTWRSVTDSASATWGMTVVGNGPNHVLTYCDGTIWTVMAR